MTKMNTRQEELLAQLEHARTTYEQFEQDLAVEIADRKWEARENMRSLVREARAANVPYRRIGIALDTSDHRTLKHYETDTRRDVR